MVPDLSTLRAAIDRLDAGVASILARRARVARRVALRKRLLGDAPRDARREQEVRDHYAQSLTVAGWSDASVDDLLGTMLHASRDLQARLRVAIQGGPGSWSEISCLANIPDVDVLHCETVRDVEAACRSSAAVAAWLPRWNSTLGAIHDTDDAASAMECWLEAPHPIAHALVAPAGLKLEDVRVVRGHPRALEQCAKTLTWLVPRARLEGTVDGAHSARTLAADGDAAVLGPGSLAARSDRCVLAENVSDEAGNTTWFHLLVPKEAY